MPVYIKSGEYMPVYIERWLCKKEIQQETKGIVYSQLRTHRSQNKSQNKGQESDQSKYFFYEILSNKLFISYQ